jgi:hypothetical protein
MNNPGDSSKPQNQPKSADTAFPSDYELRVSGRISTHAAAWFEGMTITVDETTTSPQTIIRSHLVDQAALYGLISRVRDLGLTLLAVARAGQAQEMESDVDE